MLNHFLEKGTLDLNLHLIIANQYILKTVMSSIEHYKIYRKKIFFCSLFCLPGLRPRRVATEVRSCLAVIPDLGAIVVDPPSLKTTIIQSISVFRIHIPKVNMTYGSDQLFLFFVNFQGRS